MSDVDPDDEFIEPDKPTQLVNYLLFISSSQNQIQTVKNQKQ